MYSASVHSLFPAALQSEVACASVLPVPKHVPPGSLLQAVPALSQHRTAADDTEDTVITRGCALQPMAPPAENVGVKVGARVGNRVGARVGTRVGVRVGA